MAAHQATRVVPWRDWDEWERVRVGLCGADPAARDVALARVDAWRTRSNVPHAVEVTAQLMECRKHDAGVPGSPGPHLSDTMLQLTYAMVRTTAPAHRGHVRGYRRRARSLGRVPRLSTLFLP